ncbi:enoyl-CoA hydratase [Acinetobacter sp. V91_7]|uniref:enoyl-CoA hydratase n=1 Tax=unclassified Acinetobacter TaxID=196816 RepID=UPI00287E23E5|nr:MULTISPECIES: enoyl-CoA hydratase [unclassified Acinetobacter]MDS7934034.1 enoyl-CoA hydratase [Acinetobacter sp. V91_4B]MDS7962630.1 enoyl-CoA hydratase [Acinetobacter sp. V91_7]MDS8029467.1 enoyl-CoA hydratase [Acinetobacter sp. V91_13]
MSKEIGNNFVDVDYTIQKIAIVKINRPEAKNALNGEVRKQLAQIFSKLSFNDEINAVVLTGGDEVFAAGADLKEMATATSTEMLLRHTERYWNAISQCPKPVIAAVNGYALGGGCELAMHADIIIAGKSAVFGQPEIKVGLMPGAGGTQRLFRAVGKFHAMRMIMTGAMVKAEEAYIIGLVSQVTEDDQTIPTAIQMAQSLAKMPPIALQQIKEVALMSEDVPLNAGLTLERKAFQLLFSTEDKNEGVQAFIEKRKPSYQGK